jgi:hypothetical protein
MTPARHLGWMHRGDLVLLPTERNSHRPVARFAVACLGERNNQGSLGPRRNGDDKIALGFTVNADVATRNLDLLPLARREAAGK